MMARGQEVPITGAVLSWAIDESGWTREALAEKLTISVETLSAWESETEHPTKTQFDGLVRRLRRPSATFFLPAPPLADDHDVEFRSLPGRGDELGPEERRSLRDARRIQRELSWILQDLGHREVELFPASLDQDPEQVSRSERERLGISVNTQIGWTSDGEAFEAWRTALAGIGVFSFVQQIGRERLRGFALKDDYAPVIGVNTTGFNVTSRIYTMFHEYAHLLLGQSNVLDDLAQPDRWDQTTDVERWCERFAASFLVPRDELEDYLRRAYNWTVGRSIDPSKLNGLARRFRVSRRAMALRLWEIGAAPRSLFESLGPVPERPRGGGGGERRPRLVRRRYGASVIDLLREALSEDVVDLRDVLNLLGITLDDWAELEAEAGIR